MQYFNKSLCKSTIFRSLNPLPPQKKMCITYVAYENANEGDKELLQINYDQHLEEKQLCRTENMYDIEL